MTKQPPDLISADLIGAGKPCCIPRRWQSLRAARNELWMPTEPAGGLCLHLRRRARSRAAKIGYGRYGNPTWHALEEAIGALEGGRALAFASGMAAAHAVLELVPPGGVIVIRTTAISALRRPDRRAARYGGQSTGQHRHDSEVLAATEEADVVWIESPANPTIEVADLPR